ncbi:adiponectin-like [Anneissia japonica]|uniref:adiponectin-like n=1 Tax=Anneissia japonica TaxID=1529436 RepID=UPI0014256EA5|nr:adiponectin-like [Anneissia japonica]
MSINTAILLFTIVCHVYSTNTGDQNSCNTCCNPPAGIPGIQGTNGIPGPKGDNGAKEEIGLTGEKGDIGQKGDVGQKDNKSTVGQSGCVGSPGRKGEPGPVNSMVFKSAFSVKSVGRRISRIDHRQPIQYNAVITNIGGDYNLTTAKFVCRVPGAYVFAFTGHNPYDKDLSITIMKNNQRIVSSYSGAIGVKSTSTTVVLVLVEDDEVWTQLYKRSNNINSYRFAEASFSGFLIYPAT